MKRAINFVDRATCVCTSIAVAGAVTFAHYVFLNKGSSVETVSRDALVGKLCTGVEEIMVEYKDNGGDISADDMKTVIRRCYENYMYE